MTMLLMPVLWVTLPLRNLGAHNAGSIIVEVGHLAQVDLSGGAVHDR